MRNAFIFAALLVLVIVGILYFYKRDNAMVPDKWTANNPDTASKVANRVLPSVVPVSHASAVLNWGSVVVYSDPVGDKKMYQGQPEPDIIFLTHEHSDHFSTTTIKELSVEKTSLIVSPSVADKLPLELRSKATVLVNGQSVVKNGILITAVPSYNIRTEALQNHPKGRDNGYLLEKDGVRVYFSGDSEDTPEMRGLKNIDMAFIAMNLPYTMSVESAASAVVAFKPKEVYPYHYRTPDGFSDVAEFKRLVTKEDQSIKVVQLDWYKNK